MRRLATALLIRPDELRLVAHFAMVFLVLGVGLALGRGTADALFFKRYGIEHLPMMYGVLSIVFAFTSLAYAALADRLASERFFNILLIAMAAVLLVCWLMMHFAASETVYPLYFVIYEVASELLPLHGALYLSQNLETLQLKRLSPLIFAAGQVGTIVGGIALALAVDALGVDRIVLLWAVLAVSTIPIIGRYHRRCGMSPFFYPSPARGGRIGATVREVGHGMRFARRSPLLWAASLALFFMVISFYIMCYAMNRIYNDSFATAEQLSAFFGVLTAVTSSLALLTQVFVTNRALGRWGATKLNLVAPAASVVGYTALLSSFTLPAALAGSMIRDVLMPAVRRPVRNLFFAALPDNMQGRARALSVALVLPVALALASGILVVTARLDSPAGFLVVGLLSASAYYFFNLRMNRAYTPAVLAKLEEKLFVPEQVDRLLAQANPEVLRELQVGLAHPDPDVCVAYATLLVTADRDAAARVIVNRLREADVVTRDRLFRLIAAGDVQETIDYARRALTEPGDERYHANLLCYLFERGVVPNGLEPVQLLDSPHPRLRAAGVYGVMLHGPADQRPRAIAAWGDLLRAGDPEQVHAGLATLARHPEPSVAPALVALIGGSGPVDEALDVLATWPSGPLPGLPEVLDPLRHSPDPELRRRSVNCLRLVEESDRRSWCREALEDPHPAVRRAALAVLRDSEPDWVRLLSEWLLDSHGSPRARLTMLAELERRGGRREVCDRFAVQAQHEAGQLAAAMRALDAVGEHGTVIPSIRLLRIVLAERFAQTVDLVLTALAEREGRGQIAIVQAALASGDRRQVAGACEALRHLTARTVMSELALLLEERHGVDRREAVFADVDQVLAWCENRDDSWLRACAGYARGTHQADAR